MPAGWRTSAQARCRPPALPSRSSAPPSLPAAATFPANGDRVTPPTFRRARGGNLQSMILFVVVLALLAVAIALAFVLGAGLVAAIPLLLAVAVGGWMVWAFFGA